MTVRARARGRLLDLAVVAWYLVLTAVYLWPIVTAAGSVVPHSIRDPGFQATVLFDVSTRLEHLDLLHLFDGTFFYPAHLTLAMADAQIGLQVLALPLHLAGADALVVLNILTILSFPVTALCADALGRYVSGARAGGLVVGTAFAFAAFRMEHIIHLQLLQSWSIALAFLGLEMVLRERSRRGAAIWAFALAATASSSLNYLLILAIIQPVYVAARWLLTPRRAVLVAWIRSLVVPALIAAVPIAAIVFPYFLLRTEGYRRLATNTFEFSARPLDYLVPAADSLAATWLFDLNRPVTGIDERELFPGFVVLVLALAGLAVMLARREWHRLRRLVPWIAIAAVAFVFSLGPYLWPNVATAPDRHTLIWLPYRVLARPLLLDSLRSPARFGVIVLLAVAVIAAVVLVRGLARLPRGWPRAAALAVVAVVMAVEYSVSIPVASVPWGPTLPATYQFLRAQPPGPVAVLPAVGTQVSYDMLVSTVDGHPRLDGWSGFTPRESRGIRVPITAAGVPGWLRAASSLGARYVVVHGDSVDAGTLAAVHAARDAGTLQVLGTFGRDEVYLLSPPASGSAPPAAGASAGDTGT